jgi:hypothetical protein
MTNQLRSMLDTVGLHELVTLLRAEGYAVVGPTVRDDAIVLAELSSAGELPAGWGVTAEPGHYRLVPRADGAVFAHSAGPQSWKQFLHPPRRKLFSVRRDAPWTDDDTADTDDGGDGAPPRYAFLGVRPCDLIAMGVLDGVLGRGSSADPDFTARRDGVFVVVANCTEPGGLCFCVSMGGGPRAEAGYDLVLTERVDDAGHRFLAEAGTPAGERVLAALGGRAATSPVTDDDVTTADADLTAAAGRMGRRMPEVDLRELLAGSRESPRWDDVASR